MSASPLFHNDAQYRSSIDRPYQYNQYFDRYSLSYHHPTARTPGVYFYLSPSESNDYVNPSCPCRHPWLLGTSDRSIIFMHNAGVPRLHHILPSSSIFTNHRPIIVIQFTFHFFPAHILPACLQTCLSADLPPPSVQSIHRQPLQTTKPTWADLHLDQEVGCP